MKRAALWFAIIAAVTFCTAPFLWQLLTSLRPEDQLTQLGLPRPPSIESYRAAFADQPFGWALANSLTVAAVTTVFCLTVGGAAAFVLAKLPFAGRGLLLGFALAVSMFPPIATISPLYLVIRALGLFDRPIGLVIPYTTFSLPLAMWVLTGVFRDLPDELYKAARVDGCSAFGAFYRVLLPLAAPGLATTAILVFIFAWNELLYALTFTASPARRTVPVAISLFTGEHKEPWGEIAAASVIATLPLIAATLAFQRKIVAGLTAGAVKG
jgi:multiple sugar transport system permease protein